MTYRTERHSTFLQRLAVIASGAGIGAVLLPYFSGQASNSAMAPRVFAVLMFSAPSILLMAAGSRRAIGAFLAALVHVGLVMGMAMAMRSPDYDDSGLVVFLLPMLGIPLGIAWCTLRIVCDGVRRGEQRRAQNR